MKTIELLPIFKERYAKTEAFKTLRTNLLFSGKDVKVISITSCSANEGKSSLSIELAQNLSQVGKRVLLLDADLRKSVTVSKYTNEVGISGLSEYLSGQNTLDDVLYSTQFEGFDIIFAGQYPPNPVDLLGNDTFKELLAYGREHYDYVLLDTPPLGLVIDAAVTCSLSDGALIVIGENRISYRFAKLVKEQIEMSGCRVLGVVINLVGTGHFSYYYRYYYRSHYGKYGKYYQYYYNGKRHGSDVKYGTHASSKQNGEDPSVVSGPGTGGK